MLSAWISLSDGDNLWHFHHSCHTDLNLIWFDIDLRMLTTGIGSITAIIGENNFHSYQLTLVLNVHTLAYRSLKPWRSSISVFHGTRMWRKSSKRASSKLSNTTNTRVVFWVNIGSNRIRIKARAKTPLATWASCWNKILFCEHVLLYLLRCLPLHVLF